MKRKPKPKLKSKPKRRPAPDCDAKSFRGYWRRWLNEPAMRSHIRALAMRPTAAGAAMLALLINKVYATPQAQALPGDTRPILFYIGVGGKEMPLTYAPMTLKDMGVKHGGDRTVH